MAKKDLNKKILAANKRVAVNNEDSIDSEAPEEQIDQKEVDQFVNDAPLSTNGLNNEDSTETTVISFYMSVTLEKELEKVSNKKKIVKSKIIRAAEQLYFNSDLTSKNEVGTLEKRNKKGTCAFNKNELLQRAKEKGFKKQTDYLNAVLLNMLSKV